MAESSEKSPQHIKREISGLAGFLSLLVPGAGQIYQGRVSKGLLFFVCIYLLFFYGLALGKGRNVYLPSTTPSDNPWSLSGPLGDLWNRPQYAAQFWVGLASWPAIVQWKTYNPSKEKGALFGTYQREPSSEEINEIQRNSDKLWDLGWVLTVIAGALNVMVIYDAAAGPAFPHGDKTDDEKGES